VSTVDDLLDELLDVATDLAARAAALREPARFTRIG